MLECVVFLFLFFFWFQQKKGEDQSKCWNPDSTELRLSRLLKGQEEEQDNLQLQQMFT